MDSVNQSMRANQVIQLEDLESFFECMTHGKDRISQTEWLTEFIDHNEALTPQRIRGIFRFFATKDGQKISMREMENAFVSEGMTLTNQQRKDLFDLHDVDGDGYINFQEFKNMFKS